MKDSLQAKEGVKQESDTSNALVKLALPAKQLATYVPKVPGLGYGIYDLDQS